MTLSLSIPLLMLWFAAPDPAKVGERLILLHPVDMAIIAIYFAMVLGIGFYLKRYTKSGEDFFLAGREMTAWVAGLSFISANLGALELMGWAAASYQYGILATHWYWIGAIPAILFLGLVLMPFYYISKTHSVPGYLQLRYGEPTRALSAISFAFMTVLMSGINMYAMALVMKVVLGWNIHFSIWVSSITVAVYVALGGLFSAIFNEVLQFFLIWLGALLIPILGLVETGGWNGLVARIHQNFPQGDYTHLWRGMGHFAGNPMGIHWTGIVLGLGWVISFGYWNTDFLVVQRIFAAKDIRAAKMAPIIGSYFKMAVPFIVILPGLLGLGAAALQAGSGKRRGHRPAQLQRGSAADAGALLRPRPAGTRDHRPHRRVHVGNGGERERLRHGVDLRPLPPVHPQERFRRPLRQHGTLVHHSGRHHLHRHGLPGHAFRQHHGLRPGALQLFHRAAFRHRVAGHDVEAHDARRRLLGAAGRAAFLPWPCSCW